MSIFSAARVLASPTTIAKQAEHIAYAVKNYDKPHAQALFGHAKINVEQEYRGLRPQLTGLFNTIRE